MKTVWTGIVVLVSCAIPGCKHVPIHQSARIKTEVVAKPNPVSVIHVIVALCDNKYQGIVPVPSRIGNGDDLIDNLYWGADYGVKSYFRRSKDWKLIQDIKNLNPIILERIVFQQKETGVLMVADAYRGREIRTATQDFANYAAGIAPTNLQISGKTYQVGGGADMIAYVGHDGLMNFNLPNPVKQQDTKTRRVAILCCKSQQFFKPIIRDSGAKPLLITKSLMAPEAYVLEAAAQSFIRKENIAQAAERASKAYAKYQKISLSAARTVFAAGD